MKNIIIIIIIAAMLITIMLLFIGYDWGYSNGVSDCSDKIESANVSGIDNLK